MRYLPALQGFGLVAARDFAPGEVVVLYEEQPHYLVTRAHADRLYPPGSIWRQWFDAYAWPITDEVRGALWPWAGQGTHGPCLHLHMHADARMHDMPAPAWQFPGAARP